MATPERKQQMLDRQVRRSRILAENYGTPEEVEKFQETINQPTLGDPDLEHIHILQAVNDMWEHISGYEVSEEELMEEEKIYEYRADQEEGDEPAEWQPSHAVEQGGQGQIPDEVAAAVVAGDPEGQEASEETQDVPEETQDESDIQTSAGSEEGGKSKAAGRASGSSKKGE
jgi:hypothetical protein